jgi:hypothetical protein
VTEVVTSIQSRSFVPFWEADLLPKDRGKFSSLDDLKKYGYECVSNIYEVTTIDGKSIEVEAELASEAAQKSGVQAIKSIKFKKNKVKCFFEQNDLKIISA